VILFPVPRTSWHTLRHARATVYRRDAFTCQDCGWFPSHVPVAYDGTQRIPADYGPVLQCLQLDHIVPSFKGGASVVENFQTLCKRCNARKGHKA
jgi:5-methylcytosine-specific restriction endonuclease McrA